MLKKKKTTKPNKHDFSALDAAVSELTKQTEALLGSSEDSAKKQKQPILPKKGKQPQTKGKSFDIIHPKEATQLHAMLKSAKKHTATKPVSVKKLEEPEHELLPEHATKSYNEAQPPHIPEPTETSAKTVLKKPNISSKSPAIQLHKGTLASEVNHIAKKIEPELESEAGESGDSAIEDGNVDTTKSVAHTGISFSSDALQEADITAVTDAESKVKDEAELEAEVQPSQTAELEPIDAKKDEAEVAKAETAPLDQEDSKATEDTKPLKAKPKKEQDPPVLNSGELYANNLVSESKPKGYQPSDTQQKPTVFDTNEYHPALHDWSKLENHDRGKWIILVFLICIAAGTAYYLFSNQMLPL